MPKIVLRLKDGITIKETAEGGAELHNGSQVWPLKEARPGTVQALVRLAGGGATKEELEEMAGETDWFFSDFPQYYAKLSKMGYSCFIRGHVMTGMNTLWEPVGHEEDPH